MFTPPPVLAGHVQNFDGNSIGIPEACPWLFCWISSVSNGIPLDNSSASNGNSRGVSRPRRAQNTHSCLRLRIWGSLEAGSYGPGDSPHSTTPLLVLKSSKTFCRFQPEAV